MGFNLHYVCQALRGRLEHGPSLVAVSSRAFRFYTDIDRYTGVAVQSIGEFYAAVTAFDDAALEFHVRRGDFENWFIHVLDNRNLATAVVRIRNRSLRGEALRETLMNAVKSRC